MNQTDRMRWWREARFGMFIHWGLYSQWGRGEWLMQTEGIPREEYERLADTCFIVPDAVRAWVQLAKHAGARYVVLTAKHHEGFCLWDSAQTDYNAVRRGPKRDLVREFSDACREEGLGVGLYYSLADWHHPDGLRCAEDEAARRRFVDFTHGCVRELCQNYAPDILWYDVAAPLPSAEAWESAAMNRMARALRPGLLINNRSRLPEDFDTPENKVEAAAGGRDWEACLKSNLGWGHVDPALCPGGDVEWLPIRQALRGLLTATTGGGNLLLNLGPDGQGGIPAGAARLFGQIGAWLLGHGEAAYGTVERAGALLWNSFGGWTLKGRTGYLWCIRFWPGPEMDVARLNAKVESVGLLVPGGEQPIEFSQEGSRVRLRGLPVSNPDSVAGVPVLKFTFHETPQPGPRFVVGQAGAEA